MLSVCSFTIVAWQSASEVSGRDIHIIMESEFVIAVVMAILLLGVLVAGIVALVYVKKLMSLVEELQQKTMPLIGKGSDLVDDLVPKIRSISTNVEEISFTARAKIDELGQTITQINRTVADINAKAHVQANRVDGMVTDALATTKHVSETVQQGLRTPIRQAAGIVAGFKAALQTLAERSPIKPRATGRQVSPYDL